MDPVPARYDAASQRYPCFTAATRPGKGFRFAANGEVLLCISPSGPQVGPAHRPARVAPFGKALPGQGI